MQLVAYGAQDVYLTAQPQITFFKVVYRRHTNFSMESIEQTFNGSVGLGKKVTAVISRNGDLVNGMWLEVNFGTMTTGVYGMGNALVKTAELSIGGQQIDKQYGNWLNIWSELTVPAGKRAGYDRMVGNKSANGSFDSNGHMDVPLMFWFCRNPGLALPLIALQYHEVKLDLEISSSAELTSATSGAVTLTDVKLYVDYVYLDTDERRRFAQVSHEYLIEQVQFTGDESVTASSSKKIDLTFNHPVKELIWVHQITAQHVVSGDAAYEPLQYTEIINCNTKLQLNGHDRFSARRQEYFGRVQPFKHHTNIPRASYELSLEEDGSDGSVHQDHAQFINCYSFALQPEEHQPSGTCNFSRIDNATLQFTKTTGAFVAGIIKVYAVNYNVLRIMSGMGGLAYSN
jgi:hypothetical protein